MSPPSGFLDALGLSGRAGCSTLDDRNARVARAVSHRAARGSARAIRALEGTRLAAPPASRRSPRTGLVEKEGAVDMFLNKEDDCVKVVLKP
jgi:hypothetical protein